MAKQQRKRVSALDILDEVTGPESKTPKAKAPEAERPNPYGRVGQTTTGYVTVEGVEKVRRSMLLTKAQSQALDVQAAMAGYGGRLTEYIVDKLKLGD